MANIITTASHNYQSELYYYYCTKTMEYHDTVRRVWPVRQVGAGQNYAYYDTMLYAILEIQKTDFIQIAFLYFICVPMAHDAEI